MTTAPSYRRVLDEITRLTVHVVETGLADDQNNSFERHGSDQRVTINYASAARFSDTLKDMPYEDLYQAQLDDRLFTFRMLDGALVQMSYQFVAGSLERYRLAFLPAPDLTPFQEDPELYASEAMYADIIDRRIVTVPIRFDYDCRENVAKSLTHPESHVTLGQYSGCRIAATAPVTPYYFVEFLLRSFYNSARGAVPNLPAPMANLWPECSTPEEKGYLHVGVPFQN